MRQGFAKKKRYWQGSRRHLVMGFKDSTEMLEKLKKKTNNSETYSLVVRIYLQLIRYLKKLGFSSIFLKNKAFCGNSDI